MKRFLVVVLLILVLIAAGRHQSSFGKTQEDAGGELKQTLEQVLRNQEEMLEELKYLHEQIDIVRIRSSRR